MISNLQIIGMEDVKEFINGTWGSDEIAVLFFKSETCGQCKLMLPQMERIQALKPECVIYKVDIDKNPDLVEWFSIRSLPSIVIIKNGMEISKNIGVMPMPVICKLIDDAVKNIGQ